MNIDDKRYQLCVPPPDRPDLPITITKQLFSPTAIRDTITALLSNPLMDTLVAVAPYISTYFVNLLAKTNLKKLVLLINAKDFNPEYVDNAVAAVKLAKFQSHIRKRPPGSSFIHMKVMIPHVIHNGNLVPFCAISGSVNFTKNGISISDEELIVFRDMYNINARLVTYDELLKGSILVHDSSRPSTSSPGGASKKRPPSHAR